MADCDIDWSDQTYTINAFHAIPSSCLPISVRKQLAQLLDVAGHYGGLGELLGLSPQEILHIPYVQRDHGLNTLKVFEAVESRGGFHLHDLLAALHELGRRDAVRVLTDNYHVIQEQQRREEQRTKERHFSAPTPEHSCCSRCTPPAHAPSPHPCCLPGPHAPAPYPQQPCYQPTITTPLTSQPACAHGNADAAVSLNQRQNRVILSTECGCQIRILGSSDAQRQPACPPSYLESQRHTSGSPPPHSCLPPHSIAPPRSSTEDIYRSDRTRIKTPSPSATPLHPSLGSMSMRAKRPEENDSGETRMKMNTGHAQSRNNGCTNLHTAPYGIYTQGHSRSSSSSSSSSADSEVPSAAQGNAPVANNNVYHNSPASLHTHSLQAAPASSTASSTDTSDLASLNLTINDGPSSGNSTDSTALADSGGQPGQTSVPSGFRYVEPSVSDYVPELDNAAARPEPPPQLPDHNRNAAPNSSGYRYGPVFITYDLGEGGSTKVPLANLWQFLRSNGFHAHFDQYKLTHGVSWADVTEESRQRFDNANFVVVLITPSYKQAAEGRPTVLHRGRVTHRNNVGLVHTWLRNESNNRPAARTRLIPVLAQDASFHHVPEWIRIECRDDRFYRYPTDHKEFIRDLKTKTKQLDHHRPNLAAAGAHGSRSLPTGGYSNHGMGSEPALQSV